MKHATMFITGVGSVLPDTRPDESGAHRVTNLNYREFISPMAARRMGRETKMAVIAARKALNSAGIRKPEAIITGTGLGAVSQTKRFMQSIANNGERLLNPAHFITSTHNSISSAIAHQLQCDAYNATYSQREVSFEMALSDAVDLLENNSYSTALVGGCDEHIDDLADLATEITFPRECRHGEGASYFVLSDTPTVDSVEFVGLSIRFSASTPQLVLEDLLRNNGLDGNKLTDIFVTHRSVELLRFSSVRTIVVSDLVGFSLTSSAHALYHAVETIKKNGGVAAVVNRGLRGELAVTVISKQK